MGASWLRLHILSGLLWLPLLLYVLLLLDGLYWLHLSLLLLLPWIAYVLVDGLLVLLNSLWPLLLLLLLELMDLLLLLLLRLRL